ncbi:MAG: hypothetical protein V1660_00265 [archaeon]
METNYENGEQIFLFGENNQNSNSLESRVGGISPPVQSPQKPYVKEYLPGRDFCIPKHKYEIVKWLNGYCDMNKKEKKNFEGMGKKQLYAIYFSIRKKSG